MRVDEAASAQHLGLEKDFDGVDFAVCGRKVQRRPLGRLSSCAVELRAGGDEEREDWVPTVRARNVHGRPAVVAVQIHLRTVSQEKRHELGVAGTHGMV